MLFFILLLLILLCIPFYYISEKFNATIAFAFIFIGSILSGAALICGVSVLCAFDNNTDLQTMNKIKTEIMTLNEVEDKNPGLVIILNERVSKYNEIRNHAINIRHTLIMNTDKFTSTPALVYDYNNNYVYEVNEG